MTPSRAESTRREGSSFSVPDDPGHDAALHVADDLEIDGGMPSSNGKHSKEIMAGLTSQIKVYYFHNTVLTVL